MMPVNSKYIEDFTENDFMHVVCKSVGNTLLFRNDSNRKFFLNKFATYSSSYFDTYSYILLDNHVHWLLKCTDSTGLRQHIASIPEDSRKLHQLKFQKDEISFAEALEYQFKDFFISYAMAYNKLYKRAGALFVNPFRRIKIADETHLTRLVIYIHANIVKHGIMGFFEEYRWSSYKAILSDGPTLLKRSEILDYFGGEERFIDIHKQITDDYYNSPFSLE